MRAPTAKWTQAIEYRDISILDVDQSEASLPRLSNERLWSAARRSFASLRMT